MKSERLQALVLAAALAFGYAGAATYSAWARPGIAVADGFGEGDGLTRYVVTAAADDQAALIDELAAVDGVAHAQPLDHVRALVAADGVAAGTLAAVPGVAEVELSTSVPVLGQITDPYFPQYGWNLENTGTNSYNQPVPATADADVDATAGWESGTGTGRIVAVVDTGFDSDHPDLVGSSWVNPRQGCGATDDDGNGLVGDCHGWNFYSNSADIDNGSMGSHGTSVAGVVGARAGNGLGSAGVAPDVTLMPLVIGGGESVDVRLGAEAIRYAVDNGADVITASWGGAFTGTALQELEDAVAYAAAHDVVLVAAAGNDSANRDTTILHPASLTDPNVITVGNSTAGDTVSPTSAWGATNVDLFAPGFLVATTWNDGGTRLVGGTSIAGPQVAAAYALYRAQMPGSTYAEVTQALLADVDPVPAFAGKSLTGGRLTLGHLSAPAADAVRYAFTSMTSPAGTVIPLIGVSGSAPAGDYAVALGLGMEYEGEIWALADEPVTLGCATVATDDSGSAVFELGTLVSLDGLGLAPSVQLADGRYVLTVQLLRDGISVGRASAAPLLVGSSVPAPGGGSTPGTAPEPTPGGTAPGAPGTPGEPTPPGTTVPTPLPGTPAPSTPVPGTPTPGTTIPGTTIPGTPNPGTPDPGTTDPGTPAPGRPAPGTITPAPGPTPAPGTPVPGSPAPSTPEPGTGPGTPPVGSTPMPPATGTAPGTSEPDTTTTYPSIGVFGITSLGPNTVSVAGGSLVTITGTALPARPQVLIGGTAQAAVVSESATRVTFRVPARVAGIYDVAVFAPDGSSTELPAAITHRADAPPADGSPAPGTTPGDGSTPGDPPPGSGTRPPPTEAPTTPGSPVGGPVERTGPTGERLVRSATFSALRGIWSVNCSTSCTGVVI